MPEADHLAVLVHGLWGAPKHMLSVEETLRRQYSTDHLHILVVTSIADNKTYDGIEIGGERVAHEIEGKIAELNAAGHAIKKVSIVGYSLGGLVSRFAVGILHADGLFDRVQPINFTTFASPHLGVKSPKRGARSYLFNVLGAKTLSTSGQQMFLVDNFRDTKRPLLSVMADPNSIFMRGLRRFKNRSLYANTINDRSVPYYTSMISRTDPFVELDKVALHYLNDQPPPGEVILDPSRPVSIWRKPREDMSTVERIRVASKGLPFYVVFFALLPIALPAFFLNAAYQTYQSAQRIRLHESGKAFKLDKYRVKVLEEAEAAADHAYERLTNTSREEYLPTPPPEPVSDASGRSETDSDEVKLSKRESKREKDHDFPILALTEEQFDMIDNLEKLEFDKFPVHITKVRHTHAAIVVRMQKPLSGKDSFSEGVVVLKHWAQKFEL